MPSNPSLDDGPGSRCVNRYLVGDFAPLAGTASVTTCHAATCPTGESAPALVDRLVAERDRIDRQITDLVHTRDELDTIIHNANEAMTTGNHCQPQ